MLHIKKQFVKRACQNALRSFSTSIFDSHFHIIDPKFPLHVNEGYLPESFTLDEYFSCVKDLNLNIKGGAVVSASFQQYDQKYLKHTLSTLGNNFVGVTQVPISISDEEIIELNNHRISKMFKNEYNF